MKAIFKQTVFSTVAAMIFFAAAPNSASAEPFIGEIRYVGFNFAPRDWAPCNGQLVQISQHQALFSLLGIRYGGDGRVSFRLPDMRGRVPIHQGSSSPRFQSHPLGESGGNEVYTLSIAQMPAHNHENIATSNSETTVSGGTVNATSTLYAATTSDSQTAGGNSIANSSSSLMYSSTTPTVAMKGDSVKTTINLAGLGATTTTTTTVAVANNGDSQPFPLMQPYLTVNCIVSMEGLYPLRN